MFRSIAGGKRLVHLTEAFDSDGYGITKVTTFNSRTGIAAESRYGFAQEGLLPGGFAL